MRGTRTGLEGPLIAVRVKGHVLVGGSLRNVDTPTCAEETPAKKRRGEQEWFKKEDGVTVSLTDKQKKTQHSVRHNNIITPEPDS